MYDATIYNDNAVETGEEVKDDVNNNIVAANKFFLGNQDKSNRNSNAVDLELLEKYKHIQWLRQRLRIINR